jgi:hypothetical protein
VIGALLPAESRAQPATYDAQLSYYDSGAPVAASAQSFVGADTYFSPSHTFGFADDLNVAPIAGFNGIGSYGPMVYVGNYGGELDERGPSSESQSFYRITDDINSNGVQGSLIYVTMGPDDTTQISTLTDFGDLHTFNIAFDQVSVARQSNARAFDAGWVYWVYEEGGVRPDPNRVAAEQTVRAVNDRPLESAGVRRGTGSRTVFVSMTPRSRAVPEYSKLANGHRGAGIALASGYQEFAFFDRFRFDADGGILGRTYSDTRANNWVTGPYTGLVAHTSFGPLTLYGHALGIMGMNDGDLEQDNGIGAELVPGATNRLLYAQPTRSQNRDTVDDVSPTGVLWAEAGLQLTEQASLKFAWSAIYVNNILMAEDRVRYYLPDMGFRDPGEQDYVQQLFFCGIEWVR